MSGRRLRFALEHALFMTLLGSVRALPHRWARTVGGWLGALAHLLDRRHREVARRNLAGALPELDRRARRALVRRCFRHYGGVALDILSLTRFGPAEVCRRISLVGWEHLIRAEQQGRGVLLLTGHIGNFEILAYPVALYRGVADLIVRPADNPKLDRRLRWLRERPGNRSIPRRGAARATLRSLSAGGRVFLLADQRVAPHEGIELPFLGRPATTSTLAARLSLRCRTPVVPIYCYPEPGGRFRVEVLPAIQPHGSGRAAMAELTRQYMAVTEEQIRRHPAMWLWMHDRWRHRPQPAAEAD